MTTPTSHIDLYSDAALQNPYPLYRELRDAGPAVWLPATEMFAITRYKDVRESLRNWQHFSSAQGVAANPFVNQATAGTGTQSTDPPLHDALRAIVGKPLLPAAVRELSERIVAEAEGLTDRLLARREFDAVDDLAWHLPMTVVSHLVGVPEEVRLQLPKWSAAGFNIGGGPINERSQPDFPVLQGFLGFMTDPELRGRLQAGGWGARLFEAADRGELLHERCGLMLADYLAPSLDTTASAIGSAIALFAQHPEQWDELRADPALISNAVLEVIRMETPIPSFTRVVTQDLEVDGTALPAGARVMINFASANRDERKWEQPERFDVRRKAADHMGFGHGTHTCAGMHLAQLEMRSLFAALAKRVQRFELLKGERMLNHGLRAWQHLQVAMH
jgi:cytochrome P450